MAAPQAKVVLVAPNWLGDAVMTLPAVGVLGAAGIPVSVMSRPYTARIYQGIDGVDEVVVPGGQGRLARVRRQARALRSIGATAAALCPPSFSSALGPWWARIPVRVGYQADGRGWMLTRAIPAPRRGVEHLSTSYVRLVEHALEQAGVVPPDTVAAVRIRVFDEDRREVGDLLSGAGVDSDYAVVVPGATYGPAKSWPLSRFRELIKGLSRDVPVLVAGGPAELELCGAVADGIAGATNVAGATSLGGFIALAAGAGVLVANDSGTPHVAASLGVSTVVLFGSTSPEWTRPLGDRVEILSHPVHCSPCFRKTCPTQLECFDGIAVDEVVAAARRGLGQRRGAQKGVAESDRGQ